MSSSAQASGAGRIDVGIMMGSKSDLETMRPAAKVLEALGLVVEVRVLSAHRTPEQAAAFVREATQNGAKAFICGAGGAAHLAGAVAAHTIRPVIGVPIAAGTLGGFDSLLSTVMMPPGMPVATVAVGGAENAGLLAAQIIAVGDAALAARVEAERESRRRKVLESDAEVRAQFGRGATPASGK
jgi:phosphoribosylaminoimidazole carboxylase PurE protein